jgi:hypothetical protein
MYRLMHVLVEGPDDREFFGAVIGPILQRRYDHVQVWEYARETIERRMDYFRSTRAMNADYFFMGDFNTSPCITKRKEDLLKCYEPMLHASRTVIVKAEIESWYLAGVDDQDCRELGIPTVRHTDDIRKEQFEKMMPARFGSVADFMAEILNRFRVDTAKGRNRSFCYLMDKLEAIGKKA